MLKVGDVIELKKGHRVYFELPQHFVFANKIGDFTHMNKTEVIIGEDKNGMNTNFMMGKYIVTKTHMDGGGKAMFNDEYPDGHHVWCQKAPSDREVPILVDFYQSGCFSAMIPEIEVIGHGKANWVLY